MRFFLGRIWARFINWAAPIGYEDETGFHYGEPPNDNYQK